jgi:hypothetical protein
MNIEESASAERGQVMVIMVFGMIVLLVVAGLAIDGGTVFMERRHAQNAADAGALAGTRMLAKAICNPAEVDDAAILAEVRQFVANNKVADPDNSVRADYVGYAAGNATALGAVGGGTIPAGATGISATVSIERSTYFMSLIGIDTSAASAHALAMTGPLLMAGGLRPFGVPQDLIDALDPNDPNNNGFSIEFTPTGGDIIWATGAAQHRGWMNLKYMWNSGENSAFPRAEDMSTNNNDLKEWMRNGCPDCVIYTDAFWSDGARDGDFIHAVPGAQQGATCEAPQNTVIQIPVFDIVPQCLEDIPTAKPECPTQGGGTNSHVYHIVGIASVKITACNKQGNEDGLEIELVDTTIGKGIPKLGEGLGYGEAHACDTYTQVVTLWK